MIFDITNKDLLEGKNIGKDKSKSKVYRFAVSTKTGINIDQHFGHAEELHIYDYVDGEIIFDKAVSINKYCTGIEDCDSQENKISNIISKIKGCNAILTLRIGFEPTKKLEAHGIKIFQMHERINEGIEKAVKLLEMNYEIS